MKKLFALLLACFLTINLSIPAFATEMDEKIYSSANTLPAYASTSASTRAISAPTAEWDLSVNGSYYADIPNLNEGGYTYSAKKFKPSGTDIRIAGTFYANGSELNKTRLASVELYKSSNNALVDSFTTEAFVDSAMVVKYFEGLNSGEWYYLIIKNLIYDSTDGQRAIKGGITVY